MFEEIMKLIESAEGLEVYFKFGKESKLIIKGDFLAITKLAAKTAYRQDKERDNKRELEELDRKN